MADGHANYPHIPGTLYDCWGCDDYERDRIAKAAGIERADVHGTYGEYTIDGMDADEWIRAMFGDDDE